MVAVPLLDPEQVTIDTDVMALVNNGGWVINTDAVLIHPAASFTVMECNPAGKLFTFWVVWAR